MTIHPVAPTGAALSLTPADLRLLGAEPAGLTPSLALALARAVCERAGIALSAPLELELYPDESGGVLLFAHPKPPRRRPRHFSRLHLKNL